MYMPRMGFGAEQSRTLTLRCLLHTGHLKGEASPNVSQTISSEGDLILLFDGHMGISPPHHLRRNYSIIRTRTYYQDLQSDLFGVCK